MTALRTAPARAARAVLVFRFAAFLARVRTDFFVDLVFVFRAIDPSLFSRLRPHHHWEAESALLSCQTNMGCQTVLAPLTWGSVVRMCLAGRQA